MPTIQFKGKNIVWNHHQSPLLPIHTLDKNEKLSFHQVSIKKVEPEKEENKNKNIDETQINLFEKKLKNNNSVSKGNNNQNIETNTESKKQTSNPNLIIEGDNLLALKALLHEYQGKIKCIYIDPPYNTGNEGWVYNDNVNSPMIQEWIGNTVGKDNEDFTRHDKWLCMMTPRLKLLHELLADDGVIFVSIDDNEVANLRLLMNEIWGEQNFIEEIIVQANPRGSQSSTFLANSHEYILVFSKKVSCLTLNGLSKEDGSELEYIHYDTVKEDKYRLLGLRQRGGAWKRSDRPKLYYPIYVNPVTGSVSLIENKSHCEESLPTRPSGEEGRWTWSKEKLEADKNFLLGKKVNRAGCENFWDIFRKDFLSDELEK